MLIFFKFDCVFGQLKNIMQTVQQQDKIISPPLSYTFFTGGFAFRTVFSVKRRKSKALFFAGERHHAWLFYYKNFGNKFYLLILKK